MSQYEIKRLKDLIGLKLGFVMVERIPIGMISYTISFALNVHDRTMMDSYGFNLEAKENTIYNFGRNMSSSRIPRMVAIITKIGGYKEIFLKEVMKSRYCRALHLKY